VQDRTFHNQAGCELFHDHLDTVPFLLTEVSRTIRVNDRCRPTRGVLLNSIIGYAIRDFNYDPRANGSTVGPSRQIISRPGAVSGGGGGRGREARSAPRLKKS
jgi:hypothetical protein